MFATMWISQLGLGPKKLLLITFLSIAVVSMGSLFAPSIGIFISTMTAILWCFILYKTLVFGLHKRLTTVTINNSSYEVIDHIYPLYPKKNARFLIQKGVNGVLSGIYHARQNTWVYLDIIRVFVTNVNLKPTVNAVVLGGGAGCVSYCLRRDFHVDEVDTVEISKPIISLAKKYFRPKSATGIQFIHNEAARFMAHNKRLYQLIIVDMFNGDALPSTLFHDSFLTSLRHHIAINGYIIFNFGFISNFRLDSILTSFPDMRLCVWSKSLLGFWSPGGLLQQRLFYGSGALVIPSAASALDAHIQNLKRNAK